MTPMCDLNSGNTVGWAVANVNCEGTVITITYINTSGVSQGVSKPATWEYCRPKFSSNTVYAIVELLQVDYNALTPVADTLYIVTDTPAIYLGGTQIV